MEDPLRICKKLTIYLLSLILISGFVLDSGIYVQAANNGKVIEVSTLEVKTLMKEQGDKLIILDVRDPNEYAERHLSDAILIPLNQLEGRLNELKQGKKILVVCESGFRSGIASEMLIKAGFSDIHNYTGGMSAWDGPVVVGTDSKGSTTVEKTYIEFIFDSSFSMNQKVDGKKSRMDIAKEVMKELIQDLKDSPELEIALRVYGSELPEKSSCEDSGLLQPFGPVNQVRSSILNIVDALRPEGMTPIGYSLTEAAKDFPKGGRNIIVLLTDGEESCGADPCAISRKLQEDGFILKPYIVGFALSAQAEDKVRCIGNYFSANDRESLSNALNSIMTEVVSPTFVEIQAWAGGKDVTSKTTIEILDSFGNIVEFERREKGSKAIISLEEAVYTIRCTLMMDGKAVTSKEQAVTLNKGETANIRVDFGDLMGQVTLIPQANGKDLSDQVEVIVRQGGLPVSTVWSGTPLSTKLETGTYEFIVTLKDYPSFTQEVTSYIPPNEQSKLEIDFKELPGQLFLKAYAGGQPIPPSMLSAEIYFAQAEIKKFGVDKDGLVAFLPEGSYNMTFTYTSIPEQTRTMEKVDIKSGEKREVQVTFDLPGQIRVKVLVNGAPSGDVKVNLYQNKKHLYSLEPTKDGVGSFAAGVLEGTYDLQVIPTISGFTEKWIEGVKVEPGQIVDKEVALSSTKLRINLLSDGKPYSKEDTRVMVFLSGTDDYVCDLEKVQKGVFESEIKEGLYELRIINLGSGFPDKSYRNVEVTGGETLEKTISVGGKGRVIVHLLSDGKPYSEENTRVMVYLPEEDDYVCDLEEVQEGVFESEIKEGLYELRIINLGSGFIDMTYEDVEVNPGETLEKRVELGGIGKIRFKVTLNGKLCTEDDIRLMLYLHDPDETEPDYQEYICDPEEIKPGTFFAELREGFYDLCIIDGFSQQWIRALKVTLGITLEKDIQVVFEEDW